jgi:hypothetical protein
VSGLSRHHKATQGVLQILDPDQAEHIVVGGVARSAAPGDPQRRQPFGRQPPTPAMDRQQVIGSR